MIQIRSYHFLSGLSLYTRVLGDVKPVSRGLWSRLKKAVWAYGIWSNSYYSCSRRDCGSSWEPSLFSLYFQVGTAESNTNVDLSRANMDNLSLDEKHPLHNYRLLLVAFRFITTVAGSLLIFFPLRAYNRIPGAAAGDQDVPLMVIAEHQIIYYWALTVAAVR